MIEQETVVKLYERLRKDAQANVIKSGCESLSYDLLDWRIVNNLDRMSKDVYITLSIMGKHETLIVSYDELKLGMEANNTFKMTTYIKDRMQEKLSEFVAAHIGQHVLRGCAGALVK